MAEALPEIVRTISGKGIITIPEDYLSALQILLYVQVLREPLSPSRNFTWNPDRSFYAHIAFCQDDFVVREEDVNFNSQVYELWNGQESQNLLSLICAYDGILDSFVSVGNVIGITLSRTNLIKSHPYVRPLFNRIRFECFASTALLLTLKGTSLEKCDPQDGSSQPPPSPPPPATPVPPTEPVEVSPPEDGLDDGGDTIPFPIDEPEPGGDFPQGEPCESVVMVWNTIDGSGNASQITQTVFGIVEGQRISGTPGSFEIFVTCQGNASTGCIAVQEFNLFSYTGADIEYVGVQ